MVLARVQFNIWTRPGNYGGQKFVRERSALIDGLLCGNSVVLVLSIWNCRGGPTQEIHSVVVVVIFRGAANESDESSSVTTSIHHPLRKSRRRVKKSINDNKFSHTI